MSHDAPSEVLGLLRLGTSPLEALDATTAVHQLLLARVKWVALGADLDMQIWLGRAGDELISA
jgi:hypothetical protein